MRFRLNCSNHPKMNGGITVAIDTTELDVEVGLFEPFIWSTERIKDVVDDIPYEEIANFIDEVDYANSGGARGDIRHDPDDLVEGIDIPVEEEEDDDD